jgi:hypothetical protein
MMRTVVPQKMFLRSSSVGVTVRSEHSIEMGSLLHTKSHYNRFKHSSSIKVIPKTILKAAYSWV